uniref:Testis expressed 9 n=1 Tax=Hucho hucho TaxID=62062 RepID=A0A4W5M8X6_9TELE
MPHALFHNKNSRLWKTATHTVKVRLPPPLVAQRRKTSSHDLLLCNRNATRQIQHNKMSERRIHEPKRPMSSKAERSQGGKSVRRPASVPSKKPSTIDLLAKEEEYKRINAELEAKTAELVRQAEQVMSDQNEVLSKPISFHLDVDIEDEEDFKNVNMLKSSVRKPTAKVMTKKRVTSKSNSQNRPPGNQRKAQTTKVSAVEDVAVHEDFVDFSLDRTIRNIEGKLDDGDTHDNLMEDIMPSVGDEMGSDAQIRFLKAKLCVMQEEFNRLSYECNKKDDANSSLSTNIKEVEEDRARLQKTTNIQQTQIEKHRALAEESNRKGDGLQQQVTALQKEIEGLKRAQKQAATNHSAIEVRLNRALEEVERSKTQLTKIKQMSKDTADQEHKKIETLKAENKKLEKQKAELIAGFKKQLKLIDILKRQKMHFEAAKMLSFTEEEFMKALDWGKS